MIDLDSWQEIFATMRKNRLRTALTGLGVFLGILILMIMVAFDQSLEMGVKREFAGFATNSVAIWGQRTSEPFGGLPPGRPVAFNNSDTEALRRLPEELNLLAPRSQVGGHRGGAVVHYRGKMGSYNVMGDVPASQFIEEPIMRTGRFINDHDVAEKRKVAVIGETVVKQLFVNGRDPIGEYIEMSGVYFMVIGTFGTRATGQMADRKLMMIHLPFSTFQQAFKLGDKVSWYNITAKPQFSAAELEQQVRLLLAQRHKISPRDTMAIGSWNAGKEFIKMTSVFGVMNMVMWFAGIMTLGAGVIGVVNIMLISVRERTKEIGVRKALGATPAAIVRMIVSEAVVLTMISGYLGIVAGVALIELWIKVLTVIGDKVPFGPPTVGLGLAVGAGAVIAVFGALAGVIPAAHAARIQPIEALRTE